MLQAQEHEGLITTPFGVLVARWRDTALTALSLVHAAAAPAAFSVPDWLAEPLRAYCDDPAQRFDPPLVLSGTPFQQKVWQALRTMTAGQVCTYGALARTLGTSARAVGNACRANPCLIAVPCHRVVAVNSLGGFGGATAGPQLAVKRWLLRHEARTR